MLEGGWVETLDIVTGSERMTMRVPHGFAGSVEEDKQRVVFKDKAGGMSITVQTTTNWPGAMPGDDILRSRALAANPGGNFLQLGSSPTRYRAAKFVDSFRTVDNDLTVKRRHAFVSCPEGLVEFIFSSSSADFEKGRLAFGLLLSSFQLEMAKPPSAAQDTNSPPPAP
jgi:hypothetical protein